MTPSSQSIVQRREMGVVGRFQSPKRLSAGGFERSVPPFVVVVDILVCPSVPIEYRIPPCFINPPNLLTKVFKHEKFNMFIVIIATVK